MMASRWVHSCEDDERQQARSSFCESESPEWRNLADSPAAQYPTEEEPFSWPRPKTVRLRRTSQGFGFTLRHFIVYPPESTVHCFPEEDHGRRGRQRNRLEPMDTIFVKQVKEGGPAHGAGLCTGDRLVKVNGASIIGKAYCEVISLIQDSGEFLELCVMPKDEDILQLAYSQDAYVRGRSSYSGNACHIPDPPPVCYPRVDCKPTGMAQAKDSAGQVSRGPTALPDHGYRKEITVPPSPPPKSYPKSQMAVRMCNDSVRTVVVPPDAGQIGRMVPAHRIDYMDPVYVRGRPGSLAQYPHPRKADVYPSGPGMGPYGGQLPHYPGNNQNIDWRTYQTYREYIDNKGIHSHSSRTIQERLDNLRATSQTTFGTTHHILRGDWGPKGIRRRSTSHERSYQGPPPHFQIAPRSASQDRMSGAERMSHTRNWPPRSMSQDGLMHKARAHSTDYVDPVELARPSERRGGHGRADQVTRPSRQSVPRHDMLYRPSAGYSGGMRGAPNTSFYSKGPDSLQNRSSPMLSDRNSHFVKGTSAEHSLVDQRVAVKGNHALQGQQGQSRIWAETIQGVEADRDAALVGNTSSCTNPKQMLQRRSILKPPQPDYQSQINGQSPAETGVILREKHPSGKNPSPLRHPSYILAVNDDGPDSTADVAACWLPNDARREMRIRRLGEHCHTSCSSNLDESLDSIPFIDEPISPSVDREAAPIPPSAVISVAPSITTGPSSPGSPCPPIRRQLSHDQESLRSALLESDSASKTERSKSYDEGLDNYQEEGRRRSSSKNMPGLRGLRKALDGHKSSGESGSRRDSSSDIFADSSKEGLLNFRQFSTDKNKRVGGGMRSWKPMYAVLQGHSLTLYKDRKDALSNASTPSDEVPLQISIKACLIDISYSDTRRKNVLRLTTSDCEYLFQAEGRDDMLSWIRVIQENSNPDEENAAVTSQDLISRKIKEYNMMSTPTSRSEPSPKSSRQSLSIKQAFLGGKTDGKTQSPHSPKTGEDRRALRDDSSPPRDRGAWKIGIAGIMRKPFEKKTPAGVTFGVRLDDCPAAQSNRFVPLIVEVCCTVVEERGLEYTGIYRVPGNNAAISSMQEELNSKGMTDIDVQEDKWRDLNVISSLLKSFFRKLPEPLFTNEKYADFIEANRTEDSVERLKELKRLIQELPDHHFETLKFLCAHLKKVSDNCEKNKMEPRNLAIVFGPTLVRTSEDNMTNMVNHMPDQCKIVENLIQQYDWFFTDDGDEDPVTTAEQESTVQSQPVPNIDHLLSNIGRTAASTGEVSDSACSDSSKSKGLWGSGKDQCSKEMLRSSFFASRKRKKPKDKAHPSSSDDDLDAVFPKKELPEETQQQPLWSPDSRTEEEGETDETSEKDERRNSSEEQLDKTNRKRNLSSSLTQPFTPLPPEHISSTLQSGSPYSSPPHSPNLSFRMQMTHQSSLSDPPSNYDDTVSDLGTMNSTSSQASVPRVRRGRTLALGPEAGPSGLGAEVCSITSDYSTTSSMTFLTGVELSTLSPEVQSVAESRGGDDADDERSELISEGRPMETDSESNLSVFTVGKTDLQDAPRPLPSHRLIECDTLSRKKAAQQKTVSESSLDGAWSDKDSNRLSCVMGSVKGRSTGSLSSSSRSELDKAEPAWKLKITDRLKVRLRMSVDDMFGVGTQRSRSPEGRSKKKKNIRRRHTMGGQRDFAELSVLGDWSQHVGIGSGSRSELSAVDQLKPKCSSQDFSIRDWIARERHRTSNPEVSVDLFEQQGGPCSAMSQNLGASSSSELPHRPAEVFNGDVPQSKNLSLSATAHPHKLTNSQVVHSRFYQYL
ncbi:rho GTPase-activating protein 21 isoform X1 [Etheostoma cragini]|uniref:rho GTPase-activating protein 21 isoform X1 n=2 Tax=Etheostoma cragini TaxID=417921 RepID=UPI00155E177C|nr:rho GTPase-activating protein 21 isoform X1 [Etheostoma cragini]XP_034742872.1 rho GTPase-activating protein 21 isoform X1 [Etheostoma cragini]XP_034742873.1 rho GTPase-activating protein 21 isoform X1 [Etheostoma cragini]XP_034742874.1 rho GTPase-activating protein 21 isoform X1 [Etheostoma cragini]